jgi:hypothetical protein
MPLVSGVSSTLMARRLDPAKDFKDITPSNRHSDEIGNIYSRLVWMRLKHLGYPIRDGFPPILELKSGSRSIEEIEIGDICKLNLDGIIDRLGHYLEREAAVAMDPDLRIRTLSEVYPNFDRVSKRSTGEQCLDKGCYAFLDEVKRSASFGAKT